MIAAGCDSISDDAWNAEEWANPSFLIRARPLVGDGKVKVRWASGDPSIRALDGSEANGPFSYERVRYLSQQLVEELCSSSGLTEGILREIRSEERRVGKEGGSHVRTWWGRNTTKKK